MDPGRLRRLLTASGRRRSLAWWPEAVILAAVAYAFNVTLSGVAHFPYDAEYFHYPLLRTVHDLVSSGTLPAWDAFTYGGAPLLANAQSAWLYPPHLLLAAFGVPLTEQGLDILVVVHFAVAGVATAAVARGRALSQPAVAYAGVFVVLCGATISQVEHTLMIEMLAWLPLAVLVVDRLAKGITGPRVIALGALMALITTAGFVPLVPACVALLVGNALAQPSGRRDALIGTIAGLALGFAIAAAMLLPIIAVVSTYPPLPLHQGLATLGLLTTALPDVFGHWLPSLKSYHGPNVTLAYFYLGGAGLVLAPVALMSGRPALREAALVVGLSLASFGAIATRLADAIQSLPTVGPLWRPEDVMFTVAIPLGLLLARGLDRPPAPRRLAGAALVLAALAAIPFSPQPNQTVHVLFDSPGQTALVAAVTGGGLIAAALLVRRGVGLAAGRLRPSLVLAVVAVIAVAELAAAVPDRFFVNSTGPATSTGPNKTGDGSLVLATIRERLAPGERIAADVTHLGAMWAGFPPVWQLSDVNGFQPQFSKYQLARVRATGADFQGADRTFPIVPRVLAYLRELDARYVVVGAHLDPFPGVAGYSLVFADGAYHVYRVNAPMARAYLVDPACARRTGMYGLVSCMTGPAVRSSLTGSSARRFTLATNAGKGLLITGEPWYPGWSASAHGRSLAVRRLGYLAAVTVPPGVSLVTISYQPPGLLLGAIVSVLALAGSALYLASRRYGPRNR